MTTMAATIVEEKKADITEAKKVESCEALVKVLGAHSEVRCNRPGTNTTKVKEVEVKLCNMHHRAVLAARLYYILNLPLRFWVGVSKFEGY